MEEDDIQPAGKSTNKVAGWNSCIVAGLMAISGVIGTVAFSQTGDESRESQGPSAGNRDPGPNPTPQLYGGVSPKKSSARESLSISVLVYNYAGIEPQFLAPSERQVEAIFQTVGIRIIWLEDGTPGRQPGHTNLRSVEPAPDVALRLLPSSMAAKQDLPHETTGYALPCSPDQGNCLATVFYARVEEFSRYAQAPVSRVLACAIAHEFGHLLLGPDSHSANGIMHAGWCPADFAPDALLSLLFTHAQAKLIRASVRERARQRSPEPRPRLQLAPGHAKPYRF